MKNKVCRFLGVLGLLMVAGSAFAQTIHVRANIPFSFNVDKASLPAGQYEVRTISSAGGDALVINNPEGKMSRIFLTNGVSASGSDSKQTKLVFTKYGDQYFLSQIWVASSDTGRELLKGARETELARGYTPGKVAVMAGLR